MNNEVQQLAFDETAAFEKLQVKWSKLEQALALNGLPENERHKVKTAFFCGANAILSIHLDLTGNSMPTSDMERVLAMHRGLLGLAKQLQNRVH